jgi:hypothetical protein
MKRAAIIAAALAAASVCVFALDFTPGNLVVYRVGSGTGSLVNTGSPVYLDEYTPAGVLVQSIPMPTAATLPNRNFYASGTASSEGMVTRSADGRFLVVTGYASTYTSSLANTAATVVNRVIGRIDAGGTIDTTTALSDYSSANNPRSATSNDGAQFWAAGGAGGVRHALLGAATSTDLTSATYANVRQVTIFAGQLYGSSGNGTNTFKGVSTIGTGLPTTSSQTVVRLSGLTDALCPSSDSYFFADLSTTVPGYDALYIADDTSSAAGGVQKFSLVGAAWVSNGAVEGASMTYRGIVGKVVGNTVTLYATRKGGGGATGGGELVSLVDPSGYNATITATSTVLVTAAANTAIRGVAFAPERCFAVTCTASDACHAAGTCDPATGICSNPAKPEGAACNDGASCTAGDVCASGICAGTPYTCNDGNGCTADTCNGDGTCTFTPTAAACDDGNACTEGDACFAGVCAGLPVVTREIDDSVLLTGGGVTYISWNDTPGPYNAYRGSRTGSGWVYNHALLDGNLAASPEVDAAAPDAGGSFYYLVSRVGACGESVKGRDSANNPIP